MHIGRARDLAALGTGGAQRLHGVALLVHDITGQPAPPGMAAVGHGADALSMEPVLHALRRRAEELAPRLAAPLAGLEALAGHQLSDNTVMTLAIDRVATPLRRAIRIATLCAEAGARRLRILHPAALPGAIIRLLALRGLEVVGREGEALPPAAPVRVPPGFAPLPRPRLGLALAAATAPSDIFVTAPHSDLYLLSILPVLRRTAARRPALVLLASAAELATRPDLGPGEITFLAPAPPAAETLALGDTAALEAALDEFRAAPDDAEGSALRALLADGAAARLAPMLHFAAAMQADARPHLGRIAGVTVAPGRLAGAAGLVDLANAHRIPTREIQAGPISARRALPPNAAAVFCMDATSARTYREALGVAPERLVVSGSPRIQEVLAPWRRVSRARARTLLARDPPRDRPKLLLLATQPIGVEACRRMLATALAACRERPDVALLLRPHPAEDAPYLDAYAAMLAGAAGAALAPAGASPYLLLRACDWLLTYASTLGREAMALGTPVITLNPLPHPPPYDLAAEGAAAATDAEDLAALLDAPARRVRMRVVDSAALIADAMLGQQGAPG